MAASIRAAFPSGTTATIASATTTVTTSVTVVSGDVLEAHVVVNTGADTGFSVSATANGVAADGSSVIVHSNGQTAGFERVFYWLTPSAGTYNVVATVTGGTPDVIGQKCYAVSGSDQSAPAISTFAPSGTGTTTALSITSPTMPTGSVGISHFCAGGAFTSTGQTTQCSQSLGGSAAANEMAGASAAGTGGTINFTATLSIADWYAAIVTVWGQAGGGGGGPTEDPNQTAHWRQFPPGHLAPSTALVGPKGSAQAPPIVPNPPFFTKWSDGTTPDLIVSGEDWGILANGGLNHGGDFAATYTDYFSTRQGQGYNSIMLSVFSFTGMFGGNNGPDSDGTYPFTPTTDPTTTANSTFWGRRDTFLSTAATYGFRVILNVTTPSLGGGAFPASWSTAQWSAFGTFMGNRYASQSNLMWMVGDDYFGTVDTGLSAFLSALRAAGANQPISIQNYQESSSRKDIYNGNTLSWGNANAQYNFGYSYNVSYDVVEKMGIEASPLPYFWGDGFFLASGGLTGLTDVQMMRRMIWWALSSGSKGFQVGDNDVWPWASTSLAQITAKTFYTAVVPAIASYFRNLPNWHLLVADTTNLLVTGGRGTHRSPIPSGGAGTQYADDSDSYVTASRTPTGSLAVIYMSHASTITIDESLIAAGYIATWVDPKSCAATPATTGSTYNSGSLGTNSDGQNDWALVLRAPSAVTDIARVGSLTWAGVTAVSTALVAGADTARVGSLAWSGTQAVSAASVVALSTLGSLAWSGVQASSTIGVVSPSTIGVLAWSGIPASSTALAGGATDTARVGSLAWSGVRAVSAAGVQSQSLVAGLGWSGVKATSAADVIGPARVAGLAWSGVAAASTTAVVQTDTARVGSLAWSGVNGVSVSVVVSPARVGAASWAGVAAVSSSVGLADGVPVKNPGTVLTVPVPGTSLTVPTPGTTLTLPATRTELT